MRCFTQTSPWENCVTAVSAVRWLHEGLFYLVLAFPGESSRKTNTFPSSSHARVCTLPRNAQEVYLVR